ncbi:MAG: hypothetical protein K2Y18_09275 [Alphaproteobacteria bacterium]|jgi:hypothetical protein|nr:hypothetical protein [Alphaproteobacteria bacterium]
MNKYFLYTIAACVSLSSMSLAAESSDSASENSSWVLVTKKGRPKAALAAQETSLKPSSAPLVRIVPAAPKATSLKSNAEKSKGGKAKSIVTIDPHQGKDKGTTESSEPAKKSWSSLVNAIKPSSPAVEKTKRDPQPSAGEPALKPVPKLIKHIRDIEPHKEYRNLTQYRLEDTVYEFPFEESPTCFDENFLRVLKEKIHHAQKDADKLPNVAKAAFTIFYQINDGTMEPLTIILNEVFLAGGKFLKKSDIEFKKRYRIVNAMQDLLNDKEKDDIYGRAPDDKSIALGKFMEAKLRQEVIGGAWKNNCLDSEAIFALILCKKIGYLLENKLQNTLNRQTTNRVTIKHAVLAISSYRDCCQGCEDLIQGLQWRLRDIILNFNIGKLTVDPSFGTLAIVRGSSKLVSKLKYKTGDLEQSLEKGIAVLEPGIHKLVCVRVQE